MFLVAANRNCVQLFSQIPGWSQRKDANGGTSNREPAPGKLPWGFLSRCSRPVAAAQPLQNQTRVIPLIVMLTASPHLQRVHKRPLKVKICKTASHLSLSVSPSASSAETFPLCLQPLTSPLLHFSAHPRALPLLLTAKVHVGIVQTLLMAHFPGFEQ